MLVLSKGGAGLGGSLAVFLGGGGVGVFGWWDSGIVEKGRWKAE